MILKSEIATILGIAESDIDDYVYSWAQDIFYTITGFKDVETQKWYKEFLGTHTNYILLPDTDIKSIDVIKINGVVKDYTPFKEYILNPDTGFIYFKDILLEDSFLEIQYTANAHTYTDIDGYLIALLTYKGIITFTPNKIQLVRTIRIGRYSKTFGDVFNGRRSDVGSLMAYLEKEIKNTVDIIQGNKGDLSFGVAG